MPGKKNTLFIGRNLAKKLLPLSLGIWLVISAGFPGIYFALGSRALQEHSVILAAGLSERLSEAIIDSPALWKYQTPKFVELFRNFRPHEDVMRILVLDEYRQPISHYEADTASARSELSFIRPYIGNAPLSLTITL